MFHAVGALTLSWAAAAFRSSMCGRTNAPGDVHLVIVRGPPSRCAAVSGEHQAYGYEEPNREPAHAFLRDVTSAFFEHFSLSRGMAETDISAACAHDRDARDHAASVVHQVRRRFTPLHPNGGVSLGMSRIRRSAFSIEVNPAPIARMKGAQIPVTFQIRRVEAGRLEDPDRIPRCISALSMSMSPVHLASLMASAPCVREFDPETCRLSRISDGHRTVIPACGKCPQRT
jgi:hypothetical protein